MMNTRAPAAAVGEAGWEVKRGKSQCPSVACFAEPPFLAARRPPFLICPHLFLLLLFPLPIMLSVSFCRRGDVMLGRCLHCGNARTHAHVLPLVVFGCRRCFLKSFGWLLLFFFSAGWLARCCGRKQLGVLTAGGGQRPGCCSCRRRQRRPGRHRRRRC